MADHKPIPLDEKIRILSRIITDITERNNRSKSSEIYLSQNQFLILKILFASGSLNVSKIADILMISKAGASKNIDDLVNKKLVNRKEEKSDRRLFEITLTSSGRAIVEKYYALNKAKISAVLKEFDEKEQKMLNLLLDKFISTSIDLEKDMHLFCLQCGGKYEGNCLIGDHRKGCYFNLQESN